MVYATDAFGYRFVTILAVCSTLYHFRLSLLYIIIGQKMKHTILLPLFILLSLTSFAQPDYSRYCRLNVSRGSGAADTNVYVSPFIVPAKDMGVGTFIYRHSNRFQYVLFKQHDSFSTFSKLYPDTAAINRRYSAYIRSSQVINNYFAELCGESPAKTTYTRAEMMKVASRFFLCDEVNPDSTVSAHICIGINGQKELATPKDLTTLEAFCFEAIFHYLGKKHDPAFYKNFGNCKRNAARTIPFDASFLNNVKAACYAAMENDEELKKALLHYYKKSKRNIGFVII